MAILGHKVRHHESLSQPLQPLTGVLEMSFPYPDAGAPSTRIPHQNSDPQIHDLEFSDAAELIGLGHPQEYTNTIGGFYDYGAVGVDMADMTQPAQIPNQLDGSGVDRKRNKLGYARINIACVICRRRKIRCIPSANDSRCQHCVKLTKVCEYHAVAESPQPSVSRTKSTSRASAPPTSQKSPSPSSNAYPPSGLQGAQGPAGIRPIPISVPPPSIRHASTGNASGPSGQASPIDASGKHYMGFDRMTNPRQSYYPPEQLQAPVNTGNWVNTTTAANLPGFDSVTAPYHAGVSPYTPSFYTGSEPPSAPMSANPSQVEPQWGQYPPPPPSRAYSMQSEHLPTSMSPYAGSPALSQHSGPYDRRGSAQQLPTRGFPGQNSGVAGGNLRMEEEVAGFATGFPNTVYPPLPGEMRPQQWATTAAAGAVAPGVMVWNGDAHGGGGQMGLPPHSPPQLPSPRDDAKRKRHR